MSAGGFQVKYIDAMSASGGIVFHIKRELTASTAYNVVGGNQHVVIIDDYLVEQKHGGGQQVLVSWLDDLSSKLDGLPSVHNPSFFKGFSYFLNAYDAILFEQRGFVGFENLMGRLNIDRSPIGLTRFYNEVGNLITEMNKLRPADDRVKTPDTDSGSTPVTAPFAQSIDPIELRELILGALHDNIGLQEALMILAGDLSGAIQMDVRKNQETYKELSQNQIIDRAVAAAAEAYKLYHDFAIAHNKPFAGSRGYFKKLLSLSQLDQLIFLVGLFEEILKLGKVDISQYTKTVEYLKRVVSK